jgi:hypothetical protein
MISHVHSGRNAWKINVRLRNNPTLYYKKDFFMETTEMANKLSLASDKPQICFRISEFS